MKFKLFDQILGKKEPATDPSTDDLLKQIMAPSIICDSCFFEGQESNVVVKGSNIHCHTCHYDLEQILINESGAQLAFYLPTSWDEDDKKAWVTAWKAKNFAV